MIEQGVRVCSQCGEPAGDERFCRSCGFNVAAQPELPTRREWEAGKASQTATPSPDPASAARWSARLSLSGRPAAVIPVMAVVLLIAVALPGCGSAGGGSGSRSQQTPDPSAQTCDSFGDLSGSQQDAVAAEWLQQNGQQSTSADAENMTLAGGKECSGNVVVGNNPSMDQIFSTALQNGDYQ